MTELPIEPGVMETAVRADLAALGDLTGPGQRTYAAMVRNIARAIDRRGDEPIDAPTAKAYDTLRIAMERLTAKDSHDPGQIQKLGDLFSTPSAGGSPVSPALRYPKVTR